MAVDTYSDDMFTIFGRSSEPKPTPNKNDEYYNGHQLAYFETDTSTLYLYDYDSKTWLKQ